VTGPGTVWLDLSGEVVEKDLGPDDVLLVHVGHVGIQTPGIRFDIQMVRGFRNILFGGEGLFLAHLRGPGKIWLQSMPIMILAEEIGRHLPGNTGNSSSDSGSTGASAALGGAVAGGAGAVIGGLLGGLLSGGSSDGDN